MDRLTKKIDMCEGKGSLYQPSSIQEYSTKNKHSAINKLGQLEDIEDDFGVDLILALKALRDGIYTKDYGYIFPCYLSLQKYRIFLREHREALPFCGVQGYGFSWALTREELEK